jgi:hypothetical protein
MDLRGSSPACLAWFILALIFCTEGQDPARALLAAEPRPTAPATGFREALSPFIQKHCLDCHGGEKPKAGISFEKLPDGMEVLAEARKWEKALAMLRARKMPPRSRPAPPPMELEAAAARIDAQLSLVDCSGPPDPGRPTLRRLNRAEYNNTIRDLLAIDFQPADDFPSDDVGYGFDNIGDVLSLPPLLLEKYLLAAEKVVERALVVDPVPPPVLTRHSAEFLKVTGPTGPPAKGGEVLLPGSEIRAKQEVVDDGDYLLRTRVAGRKGGGKAIRVVFKLDGKEVKVHDLRAGDGVFQVLEARAHLARGTRRFQVVFTTDGAPPEKPGAKGKPAPKENPAEKKDHKDPGGKKKAAPAAPAPARPPARLLVVEYLSLEGPLDARPRPLPESHKRIMVSSPDEKNPADRARKVLENFARRAWRRPPAREEVDRLVRIASQGLRAKENLERALGPALQAVLASPHFVFKVEADRGPPGSVSPVSDHELAVRLSYFLWSSMPDEELSGLADRGELRRPGVLEAQSARMLDDPKSRALVENFAEQWLQTRNLRWFEPDRTRFPSFDEKLRGDMLLETDLFFESVFREDRSVLEFLSSDWTFLNERLARHYGVGGIQGEQFRKVKLEGPTRGGVLTQAAVLAVTSNPTRTSPVKRGKWILEQVLGSPPPPPPPGVGDLNEAPEAVEAQSLRKRMDEHRKKADCAACHARMDALGFGLENYDAVGAWREKDGKFAVDSSGTLPSGETFRGPGELKAILLREKDGFLRSLTEKMLTFALGRGLEYHDRCTVEAVAKAVAADGFKARTLIREVVKSAPFQLRKRPASSETPVAQKAAQEGTRKKP